MTTGARMTFGIAVDLGPGAGPLTTRLRDVEPLVRAAERHGFTSVWLGESYRSAAVGFHTPSPLIALGIISQWTSMRLGTGVTLLPAWHPVRLAYDAAFLDVLSEGRLNLGIGLGSAALWSRFGHSRDQLATYVDESLALMQTLWRGESRFEGELLRSDAPIYPLPVQDGGPPLFIGGKIRRSVARAATYGAAYYASTSDLFSGVTRQSARYREELHKQGRDPAGAVVAANRITVVDDGSGEAVDWARRYGGAVLEHYANVASTIAQDRLRAASGIDSGTEAGAESGAGLPHVAGTHVFDHVAAELCLVGSVAEVVDQVQRYADVGVTQIFARVAPAELPIEVAISTVELLGEHVLPRFATA